MLVAEDDAAIRRLLVRVLARAGFDTEAVTNGRDAIDRIAATAYDVILLDLMMPGVNGFDVLQWVRLERPEAAKRFVVLTAVAEREMRHLQASEVCAVIRKPFELDDITKTVRSCAGEAEPAGESPPINGLSPETA